MDLKEIAEAYQLVYEKKKLDPVGKEDDDVDNDGDSDSSDEYLKKRRAAIGKAMGKDGDDKDDDDNGDSKGLSAGQKKLPPQLQKAIAKKGKKSDKKESLDLMSAYYSMYEHHKKDEDGNTIPHEDEIEEEVISETPKGDAGKSKSTKIADRSARSYGGSGTYGGKYNAPARDVIHDMKRGVKKDKGHVDRPGKKTSKFIDDRSSDFHTSGQGLKGSTKYGKSDYDEPSRRKDTVIKLKTRKEEIDLSFVDTLTEQELDYLVEEVVYDLLDEGIELDAVEGAFTQYLEEARVTYGSDTENPMVAQVKKRKEEKAKAQKERAEKFKKSVGKAVQGVKAKAHSPLADYAGKRGLIPAKSKMAKPDGRKKIYRGEGGKAQLEKDKAKYSKSKDKKQTATNIKVSMMGGEGKAKRQGLRSAVFKDVKDRIGKKTSDVKSDVKKKAKAVIDAPRKAGEGIRKGVGSLVKKGRSAVGGGISKAGGALQALGKKMQEQGGELDMFDTVTAYLIDEGLVKDFDHAQRVMTTLDSTLIEEVHAQQMQLLEGYGGSTDKPMLVTNADKKGNTPAYQNFKKGMKSKVTGKPMYKAADHMKNESLTDAYLQVYAEKLDPMDFGKTASYLDELSNTTTANYLYHAKFDKDYVHGGKMGKYAKARNKGLERAEKKLGPEISKKISRDASSDAQSMRRSAGEGKFPRKYKVHSNKYKGPYAAREESK